MEKQLHSEVVRSCGSFDGLQNGLLRAFSFNNVLRSTATPIWGHIDLRCSATVSKYKAVY